MDYERERRRKKRYREAMRNRIIAAVLLAGIIVGAIFIIKGCKKDDAPADEVYEIRCNLDDCTGEDLAFARERLEELGYIASYWGDSGAGARRRYYTITSAGREACHRLLGEWQETKEIMDKLLEVEEKL